MSDKELSEALRRIIEKELKSLIELVTFIFNKNIQLFLFLKIKFRVLFIITK